MADLDGEWIMDTEKLRSAAGFLSRGAKVINTLMPLTYGNHGKNSYDAVRETMTAFGLVDIIKAYDILCQESFIVQNKYPIVRTITFHPTPEKLSAKMADVVAFVNGVVANPFFHSEVQNLRTNAENSVASAALAVRDLIETIYFCC